MSCIEWDGGPAGDYDCEHVYQRLDVVCKQLGLSKAQITAARVGGRTKSIRLTLIDNHCDGQLEDLPPLLLGVPLPVGLPTALFSGDSVVEGALKQCVLAIMEVLDHSPVRFGKIHFWINGGRIERAGFEVTFLRGEPPVVCGPAWIVSR